MTCNNSKKCLKTCQPIIDCITSNKYLCRRIQTQNLVNPPPPKKKSFDADPPRKSTKQNFPRVQSEKAGYNLRELVPLSDMLTATLEKQ